MNYKTLKFSIILGAFALVTSNSMYAQQKGGNRERKAPPSFTELLKKMDKDDDGKLSKEEIKGPLKDDFDQVDLNEDGYINEEEFEKAPRPKRRERD